MFYEEASLLLLDVFPGDELLDVRMIDIENDHLGCPPGGSTRFDRTGCPVADLEERHQARTLAPTGQGLALGAQAREIGSGTRTHLEQAGLPDPQVHDSPLVDQVVGHRLDETGMGGGPGVGIGGRDQVAGRLVDVPETLRGPGDPVLVGQAGVEPLRAVGRGHLVGQHVLEFVLERLGIGGAFEVPVGLAPVPPGLGQAVEHVLGRVLGSQPRVAVSVDDRCAAVVDLGDAGLAEVFGDDDVGGYLRPGGRNFDVLHLEDDRPVRVGYPRFTAIPRRTLVGIVAFDREPALDPQSLTRVCHVALPDQAPGARVRPLFSRVISRRNRTKQCNNTLVVCQGASRPSCLPRTFSIRLRAG